MAALFLALLYFAYATAAGPVTPTNICAIESAAISKLHAYPSANSFCSTFIGIKIQTRTAASTVTPLPITVTSSVTSTASPILVTSTTTIGTTLTSTISSFITPTSTATSTTTVTNIISCVSSATTINLSSKLNKRAAAQQLKTSTSTSSSYTIPPVLQTFAPSVLSTACSCLSLPTPSTTTTLTTTLAPSIVTSKSVGIVTPTTTVLATSVSIVTTTITNIVSADATTTTAILTSTSSVVQPTGIPWYYYRGADYGVYSTTTKQLDYSKVPAVINSLHNNHSYEVIGTVQNINDFSSGNGNLYIGEQPIPNAVTKYTVLYQGYLYAAVGAGTYGIYLDTPGNVDVLWTGPDKAYGSAWTYDNADAIKKRTTKSGFEDTNGIVIKYIDLAAGEAYPLTFFLGDVPTAPNRPDAVLNFFLVFPNGTTAYQQTVSSRREHTRRMISRDPTLLDFSSASATEQGYSCLENHFLVFSPNLGRGGKIVSNRSPSSNSGLHLLRG